MPDWDIAVGETMSRRELHRRWGGAWYGGMEPAVKAQSIFLFTNPSVGEHFGYNYEGLHQDGTYHYTGDGQMGDQSPTVGGNRGLLNAPQLGRAIRLFRSEGTNTTYVGEFQLAEPSLYPAQAPDRNKEMRQVLLFKLAPIELVASEVVDVAIDPLGPEEIPLEASNIDAYPIARPDDPPIAVRREAELVKQYADWLNVRVEETVRHRIPLPSGGYLYTDVFNKARGELIEAKAPRLASTFVRDLGRYSTTADFFPTNPVLCSCRPGPPMILLPFSWPPDRAHLEE